MFYDIIFLILASSNIPTQPSASLGKPISSRPSGRGSSMRSEKKNVFAKYGRGLSLYFKRKSNDTSMEDNPSEWCVITNIIYLYNDIFHYQIKRLKLSSLRYTITISFILVMEIKVTELKVKEI